MMSNEQEKVNNFSSMKQDLDVITRIIADTVPIGLIYLFGSYANGHTGAQAKSFS